MQSIANHRHLLSFLSKSRHFHSSVCTRARRQKQPQVALSNEQLKGIDNYVHPPGFQDDDVKEAFMAAQDDGGVDATSAGHLKLRRDRQVIQYLRLIENELPELVKLRKPFTPPTNQPLIVRSIDYAGEEHPATTKRTVTVAIGQLPLKDAAAVHKFKVLAGVRWTPHPPKDAGVGPGEIGREHGYIKISCEDFPQPAQNLKWISDIIDKLIAEANDSKETFADVPHDTRHLVAKARKAKLGEHRSGHVFQRPTIRDFPKEWLPASNEQTNVSPMGDAGRTVAAE